MGGGILTPLSPPCTSEAQMILERNQRWLLLVNSLPKRKLDTTTLLLRGTYMSRAIFWASTILRGASLPLVLQPRLLIITAQSRPN